MLSINEYIYTYVLYVADSITITKQISLVLRNEK